MLPPLLRLGAKAQQTNCPVRNPTPWGYKRVDILPRHHKGNLPAGGGNGGLGLWQARQKGLVVPIPPAPRLSSLPSLPLCSLIPNSMKSLVTILAEDSQVSWDFIAQPIIVVVMNIEFPGRGAKLTLPARCHNRGCPLNLPLRGSDVLLVFDVAHEST